MVTTRDMYNRIIRYYKSGLELKNIITIISYYYQISKTESKRIVEYSIYCYVKKLGFCPIESEDLTDDKKHILYRLCGIE